MASADFRHSSVLSQNVEIVKAARPTLARHHWHFALLAVYPLSRSYYAQRLQAQSSVKPCDN